MGRQWSREWESSLNCLHAWDDPETSTPHWRCEQWIFQPPSTPIETENAPNEHNQDSCMKYEQKFVCNSPPDITKQWCMGTKKTNKTVNMSSCVMPIHGLWHCSYHNKKQKSVRKKKQWYIHNQPHQRIGGVPFQALMQYQHTTPYPQRMLQREDVLIIVPKVVEEIPLT